MVMTGTLRCMAAAIAILAASVHAEDPAAAATWPTEIREGVFSFFPDEAGEDPDDGPGRRSLRRALSTTGGVSYDTNSVRNAVESKCDALLWGKEVDHDDASTIIGDNAVSYFGNNEDAVRQWLIRWSGLSTETSTADIVQFLVRNGDFDLSSGKLDGGVATYKRWTENCHFCLKKTFVGVSCDRCGSWSEPTPVKHQPYICLTYKPGTKQTPKLIKFVGGTGMCMDYNYGSAIHNVYMHPCHQENNQKWYLTSDGLLQTPHDDTRCVDMDLRTEENKNVYLHACHGRKNQQWTFTRGRIRNFAAPNMCLDMDLETKNLYVHDCHDGWNQFFRWA